MSLRVGGLLISRKIGETVTLFYGGPKGTKRVLHFQKIDGEGAVIITLDGITYDLFPDEKVLVGTDSIYLESVEGGRAMFRFLFSDAVKIVRSELLGGYGNGGTDSTGGTARHFHPVDQTGEAAGGDAPKDHQDR